MKLNIERLIRKSKTTKATVEPELVRDGYKYYVILTFTQPDATKAYVTMKYRFTISEWRKVNALMEAQHAGFECL